MAKENHGDSQGLDGERAHKGSLVKTIAIVAASAVGGVMLAASVVPRITHADEHVEPAVEEHHGPPPVGTTLELDNIIVNPAGTSGMRYLMVTVAIEIEGAGGHGGGGIEEQEHRIRDRVVAVLERQTLEMLTAPGARDSLKVLLAEAVAPYLESEPHIYLPHFVIQ